MIPMPMADERPIQMLDVSRSKGIEKAYGIVPGVVKCGQIPVVRPEQNGQSLPDI